MKNNNSKKSKKNQNKKADKSQNLSPKLFVSLGGVVLLFLIFWFWPSQPVIDPWNEAVMMMDSSEKANDKQLSKKLLEEGGQKLLKISEEHPYHARIHFYAGRYFYLTGKIDSAVKRLKRSIKMDEGSTVNQIRFQAEDMLIKILIEESNKAIESGNLEKAAELVEKAYRQNPDNYMVINQKAVLFHKNMELEKAITLYEKTLRKKPGYLPASDNLTIAYLQTASRNMKVKRYDTASFFFNKALKLKPDNADAWNNIGTIAGMNGNYGKAAEYFRKALEYQPGHQRAKKNLRAVMKQLNQ